MSLTATDKGNVEFTITPAGQYIGRCFKIIDMGTQTTTGQYGTKEQHKVMISWELLDSERMEDGRPYSVTQFYTVSLHEKSKLRADLEAWRGRKFSTEELAGFDLSAVMGAYCMIQVVHDETGKYANVQTIMAYKGDKPAPVNENVIFDIDKPDMKVFEAMSDNMKAKIQAAPEWKGPAVEKPKPSPEAANKDVTIEDINNDMNPKPKESGEPAEVDDPELRKAIDNTFDGEEVNLEDIPF